jgi:uncharacterized membrane protein
MARWTEIPDASARAALAAYFSKVDRALAPLPREDAEEIRNELEAHVLDALAGGGGAAEALAQLGDPDDFLPTLVADRLRARAGRTMQPGDVMKALGRGGAAGVGGALLTLAAGLGYAVALMLVILGVLKPFAPDTVGLYRLESGGIFLGAWDDSTLRATDLLGMWFSPLAIAAGVGLYVLLTWAFGRTTVRRSAPIGREAMND